MVETLNARRAAELLPTLDLDIVDIRDEHEWASGHVPGARVVPYETLRDNPEAFLQKDRPVLFVCAKGVRSLAMAKLADRLGFEKIYNLDGGTNGWAKAGLSLEAQRAAA
jgi:rhodanese-related sulfurtransferase